MVDRTCLGCEYFDCGGAATAAAARETGVPVGGDCLNSFSSPKFETTSDDSCSGWQEDSTSEEEVD